MDALHTAVDLNSYDDQPGTRKFPAKACYKRLADPFCIGNSEVDASYTKAHMHKPKNTD